MRQLSPLKDQISEDVVKMLTPELKVIEVDIKQEEELKPEYNTAYWKIEPEANIDDMMADYE